MPTHSPLATIILAAGKGTRMKSPKAKVLHEVFFQPMIHHVLHAIEPLHAEKSIVIVGHQKVAVENVLEGYSVTCVEQKEQKGTGHAVLSAEAALNDFSGNVMVLCGDSPLLLTKHLKEMVQAHNESGAPLTIMTTSLDIPTNYGRIIVDDFSNVIEIIEEKDATPKQRCIKEINAGIYCVEKELLFNTLKQVTTDNSQGEMYLTDIVSIAAKNGCKVQKYEHPNPVHVLGVNSRVELSQAHAEIQARRNSELMESGITMHNPLSISVEPAAKVAPGCVLSQHVTISGVSFIGTDTFVGPGVAIYDAHIGNNVHIGANSVLANCSIDEGEIVPPLTSIKGKN